MEHTVSGSGTEAMVMLTDSPSLSRVSPQREMDILKDWFISFSLHMINIFLHLEISLFSAAQLQDGPFSNSNLFFYKPVTSSFEAQPVWEATVEQQGCLRHTEGCCSMFLIVAPLFLHSLLCLFTHKTLSTDDRGWDGWMASLTRWTWVWVNSGSWWWTGGPGVLRFMGSQRLGHDWATDLIWFDHDMMFTSYSRSPTKKYSIYLCYYPVNLDDFNFCCNRVQCVLLKNSTMFTNAKYIIWLPVENT